MFVVNKYSVLNDGFTVFWQQRRRQFSRNLRKLVCGRLFNLNSSLIFMQVFLTSSSPTSEVVQLVVSTFRQRAISQKSSLMPGAGYPSELVKPIPPPSVFEAEVTSQDENTFPWLSKDICSFSSWFVRLSNIYWLIACCPMHGTGTKQSRSSLVVQTCGGEGGVLQIVLQINT